MPPWNKALAAHLKGAEFFVNLALVGIVIVTLYILLMGKSHAKAIWLAYLILP